MSYCSQSTITDAALAHLKGIHTLDMSYCNQSTITDAAFAHLKGIHTLDMRGCDQFTDTDAIEHLNHVVDLRLPGEDLSEEDLESRAPAGDQDLHDDEDNEDLGDEHAR